MSALAGLVDKGWMAPDWAEALAPVDEQVATMGRFLRDEDAAGRGYLPTGDLVFHAFRRPLADVKVLIVGQDPYPDPTHPVGLSFSVRPDVVIPDSLRNIFRELMSDLQVPRPATGDLTPWADAGVLLLNRALTVQPRVRNSHQGKGWEPITEQAIRALAARGGPLAAILWGSPARACKKFLGDVPVVESVHPSPLSANRGDFFGSKPFSRANALLVERGGEPVDWSLPSASVE